MILLENAGYPVSDERREAAKLLRKQAGTKPHEILAVHQRSFAGSATRRHGCGKARQSITRNCLNRHDEFAGDLNEILKLPLPKAKQALRKFPGIGEPGAEKILLFTRAYPVLGLDSNGLRVLLRLGFGEEKKNYSATYRTVQEAIRIS